MNHHEIEQNHDGRDLLHLAMDDGSGQTRPGVVILPSFLNRAAVEQDYGQRLVDLGYSVLAADTLGKDLLGLDGGKEEDRKKAFSAMEDRLSDRGAFVKQQQAILELAKGLDSFDADRVAVMGFCFGGLCTLDLARSGADFQVAASFHGLLKIPNFRTEKVKPKVAVFHGWDDPMAPPADVVALGQELTEQGACDWQIHAYGGVGHAFTNPQAGKLEIDGVEHDATAASRAWDSFCDLIGATLRQ